MESKMQEKTDQNIDSYLYESGIQGKIETIELSGNQFSTETGVNLPKHAAALTIETEEIAPVIPGVVDDLINLYDDYDIYLINEEIVCTEPFTYENDVTADDHLTATCSTSETIIYDEDDHSQYLIVEDHSDETDMNQKILHLTEECSSSLMIEAKDFLRCVLCNTFCNNKSEWIDHHKLHNIWICFECDTKFDAESKLTEHTAKFHNISSNVAESTQQSSTNTLDAKPHVCKFCNVRFAREKALISHENIHKNQYNKSHQLTCKNCKEEFSKQQALNEHLTICSVNYLSLSPTSKTSAKTKKSTKKRRKQSVFQDNNETTKKLNDPHANKAINYKISCPECDKMFPTKQKMYRHKWIHRKKAFSCEICAMSFLLRIELDKHRLCEHAEQKKYMCGECGKSFASRQGLWEHNRLHDTSNQVPYHCSQCGKNFTSRQGYLIHLRTHTGEKPFTCTYCDKSFRDGGTLRKHLRIHTGERPHKCPLCEKSFNQKVVMREHIRWVHASNKAEYPDPAPYSCALCSSNTTLSDREELCTHIVKHSDQIAAIIKQSSKSPDSEDNDSESDSSDSLTVDQSTTGMKCDQKVIRRNRKLLSKLLNKQRTPEATQTKTINHSIDNRGEQESLIKKTIECTQGVDYKCDICKENCNVKEIFCDHILMQIIG